MKEARILDGECKILLLNCKDSHGWNLNSLLGEEDKQIWKFWMKLEDAVTQERELLGEVRKKCFLIIKKG